MLSCEMQKRVDTALSEKIGEELDHEALSALLATSHGVRTQISTALQLEDLGFQKFPSTGLAIYQSWPSLQRLAIQSTMSSSAVKYLVNCSLPQLQSLNINNWDLDLLAAADLSKGNWPKLEWLNICAPSAAVLQQIAKGNWPKLTDLNITRFAQERKYLQLQDFSFTKMDPLQASQWPVLKTLKASSWNCIHLSAANQQCKWPHLTHLTTSHIAAGSQAPSLKELCLEVVTRPDSLPNALTMDLPALEHLELSLCHGNEEYSSPDVALTIASRGGWPALQRLYLPNQRLGQASLAPLLQTDWPHLQELDLSYNHLHAGSIEILVACDWPCLKYLNLCVNDLEVNAVEILVQGKWPHLCHLDLTVNDLCEAACQHLARGAWPGLTSLDLIDCELDVSCLYQLVQGGWPDLEYLAVPDNADLSVIDVYNVSQDVVQKVIDCEYAGMFCSWLDKYGNTTELSKLDDMSSRELVSYFNLQKTCKP